MPGTLNRSERAATKKCRCALQEIRKHFEIAMNYGSGWIIFEETAQEQESRVLLSILSPRKSFRDVAAYMQQLFIDRTGLIRDRLEFKKNPKSAGYQVQSDRGTNPLYIGNEPVVFGIRADKIMLKGNTLEFFYKILVNPFDDPLQARFETRSQSLAVGT
jgi:hypothetical protein